MTNVECLLENKTNLTGSLTNSFLIQYDVFLFKHSRNLLKDYYYQPHVFPTVIADVFYEPKIAFLKWLL